MLRRKNAYGSKQAFILGMPGASAKEVVDAAARAGIQTTVAYVGRIRYLAKSKGWQPGARTARQATKTEFVLGMPDVPAQDVLAAAKKAGIKLSARHIYVIRSAAKTKARRGRGRGGRGGGAAEADLRRAIAELGLARARQVLAEVEASFR